MRPDIKKHNVWSANGSNEIIAVCFNVFRTEIEVIVTLRQVLVPYVTHVLSHYALEYEPTLSTSSPIRMLSQYAARPTSTHSTTQSQ